MKHIAYQLTTDSTQLSESASVIGDDGRKPSDFVAKVWRRAKEDYADPSDNQIELDDLEHYVHNSPCARISERNGLIWVQAWVLVQDEE
jgi:hypothetical protein